MLIRLVLIILVVASIGGGIHYLRQQKDAAMEAMSAREFPPAAVTVVEAAEEQWRQTLFAVGTTEAEQGIDVVAPLPGSIVEINFESGQQVKRGQPLVKQDVGIHMAELDGLDATVELRTVQFERAQKLLKDKQISQSDYDGARAALDEAKAEREAKRAFIVRKTVYAPFDGTLGIRMIDLGSYLEPGDSIVPLQMLDPIHVDYALPEQYLSRLSVGQAVEIQVPAYPGEKFRGEITAFDPGIDPSTRNVRIRASFSNADRRLRPGMFAEVWTIEREDKRVIALPETAVTYSPFGNTIFVVAEQGDGHVVQRRQIETGDMRDGKVEIISGIKPGDRIVGAGHNKLRNGMRVIEVSDPTLAQEGQPEPAS